MSRRIGVDLFLISGLILFLELVCIRWFPAHVIYLSFFTNLILLASFVGMSLGCLTATHVRNHLEKTPHWMLLTFGLGFVLELFRKGLERRVSVGESTAAEVIFFGAELGAKKELSFAIPIELFGGLFFLLIALIFIGPGQELGRAFKRVPNRNRAYGINLLGSSAGIVLFAAISWLSLPPILWLTLVAMGVVYFLIPASGGRKSPELAPEFLLKTGDVRPPLAGIVCLFLTVLVVADPHGWFQPFRVTQWSPYYRIDFEDGDLRTNLGWHQHIWDFEQKDPAPPVAYDLPLLIRNTYETSSGSRVMMIGSGSGNDLSRVLKYSSADTRVDAVEIDPVIQRIGKKAHPAKPYADPRVTLYLNDGRNHLRKMAEEHPGEYDLILFGVVDSLVLHSGYSSLRLESFLFTKEAFDDVRKCLKPGGLFMVYNYFRQGWLVSRLRDTLQTSFNQEPIALTIPGREQHRPDERFDGFTLFIAGHRETITKLPANLQVVLAPFANSIRITTIASDPEGRLATDDWPFFYQRDRSIPSLTLKGMAMMVGCTAILFWWFCARNRERSSPIPDTRFPIPDTRMFFLGAGFMLIETRAVVQMALLFGSTWIVNVFVFLGVLILSFVANLLAGWIKPKNLVLCYIGLFGTLLLQRLVTLDNLLALERSIQVVVALGLVLGPMLFAGIIFAESFRRTPSPDRAYGLNVLGALVGGLAENLSMLLGFLNLLWVALAFYAFSIWTRKPARQDESGV
jgi:hypothetical protein